MNLFFFRKKPPPVSDEGARQNSAVVVAEAERRTLEGAAVAEGGGVSLPEEQADPGIYLVWQREQQRAAAELRHLSSSTEGEFLTIGEQLQGFYQRASEITTTVSTLVNQLGGEKSSAAMAGLSGILDVMGGNLDGGGQRGVQSALSTILDQLHQVTVPLTGFGQMNKMLGMFGMYTKIESAHLGARGAGFQSLAKDVTKLSDEVSSKADTVLQRTGELASVIQGALAEVVSMGGEQRAKILSVLDKTRQSLTLLSSIVDRCSSSAGRISATSQEVTNDLGEVVFSLQAHDTVRQQIEHVAEALEELAARMPSSGPFPTSGTGEEGGLVVEVGVLCQIQAEQLRHASAELMNAVESIIAHLRDIAVKETAMSSDTQELVGVTDQAGSSFFSEMGKDLESVMASLSATVATSRQLSEVMTNAAETVGGIFGFVHDIETIAYDIKLTALNFLIKARALGRAGSGLGVLADAIRRLSDEAREQAAGVTGILNEVKAVTDCMCQEAIAESAAMEEKVSEMQRDVEETLSSLQEMSGGVGQALVCANAMAGQLSDDINTLTSGITVHRHMAGILTETGVALEGIVSGAKELTPEAEWSATTERLRALDDRYTMHSERNIHAAVVNALTGGDEEGDWQLAAPVQGEAPATGGGSDDLGDNVELF